MLLRTYVSHHTYAYSIATVCRNFGSWINYFVNYGLLLKIIALGFQIKDLHDLVNILGPGGPQSVHQTLYI